MDKIDKKKVKAKRISAYPQNMHEACHQINMVSGNDPYGRYTETDKVKKKEDRDFKKDELF